MIALALNSQQKAFLFFSFFFFFCVCGIIFQRPREKTTTITAAEYITTIQQFSCYFFYSPIPFLSPPLPNPPGPKQILTTAIKLLLFSHMLTRHTAINPHLLAKYEICHHVIKAVLFAVSGICKYSNYCNFVH